MVKFKIGDMVQNLESAGYTNLSIGDMGTVRKGYNYNPGWFLVEGIRQNGKKFRKGLRENDGRWKLALGDWDL